MKPDTIVRIKSGDGKTGCTGRVLRTNGNICAVESGDFPAELIGKRVFIRQDDVSTGALVKDYRDGEILLDTSYDDKRSFFRVDDVMPLEIRKAGESPKCSSRFLSPFFTTDGVDLKGLDSQEDPLTELLKAINSKLDFLINTVMLKEEGLDYEDTKPVNISATGMRFNFRDEMRPGDIVEMKMVLPTYPPVAILTYGEVVRTNKVPKDDGLIYETAVRFTEMTEEVREEIIQYTLKRQRDVIKGKKEEE